MGQGKGMSIDMYEFIQSNKDRVGYDLENGLIETPRGTNGTVCSSTGYLKVKVNKKALQVHQLLAVKYFGGSCIGYQVNHKDGDKLNNTRENLELLTREENITHALSTGLYDRSIETLRTLKGESQHLSKLTEDDVRFIRSSTNTPKELSEMYGVHENTIRKVIKRKTWKHIK